MRKTLIMSVMAVLTFGAWADYSFQVDINHIEKGGVIAGTIPATVSVALVDLGGKASVPANGIGPSTKMQSVYVTTVKFANPEFGIDQKYFSLVDGSMRFDVKSFMVDRNYERLKMTTTDGATVNISWPYGNGDGLEIIVGELGGIDGSKYFSGWSTEDIQDYIADGNLLTMFTANSETRTLDVSYNLIGEVGAGQFGSNTEFAAISPVPEPTSGLLLLMGVAGLALKRRRVA